MSTRPVPFGVTRELSHGERLQLVRRAPAALRERGKSGTVPLDAREMLRPRGSHSYLTVTQEHSDVLEQQPLGAMPLLELAAVI